MATGLVSEDEKTSLELKTTGRGEKGSLIFYYTGSNQKAEAT